MTESRNLVDEMAVLARGETVRLTLGLARWWIDQFKTRYVSDASSQWWWQTLRVSASRIDYGEHNGLGLIEDHVRDWGPLVLIVSDEKPNPDGCFLGFGSDLVALLRETRNHEFVLMTVACDRWVFDTHDNAFYTFVG